MCFHYVIALIKHSASISRSEYEWGSDLLFDMPHFKEFHGNTKLYHV